MTEKKTTTDTPTEDLGLTKRGTPRKRAYKTDRKARAPKFDPKKVTILANKGVSRADIATLESVGVTSINSYLKRVKDGQKAIDSFRNLRADSFSRVQAISATLQERLLLSFLDMDEADFAQLPPATKGSLIDICARVGGIAFDKERLELNKTTANIGVLAGIIEGAHDEPKKEPKQV